MAMIDPTYRVRYTLSVTGRPRSPAEVRTLDLDGPLSEVPGRLPTGAYILFIDDLAVGETVHWTRWPAAIRPGGGG
jgi:hypothetical protein